LFRCPHFCRHHLVFIDRVSKRTLSLQEDLKTLLTRSIIALICLSIAFKVHAVSGRVRARLHDDADADAEP